MKPTENTQALSSTICENEEFKEALNYCDTAGNSTLRRWVRDHILSFHKPQYSGWDHCITSGNSASIADLLRVMTNPGDYIFMEKYTFITTIKFARSYGLQIIALEMDEGGINVESMRTTLSQLNPSCEMINGGRTPILYTIPTAQNPIGVTQSASRRREILDVCRKYQLAIIEDDPYYWIEEDVTTHEAGKALPSYLSLDTDGRVIRLDTFSKTLAPGLRVGFMTASQRIIEPFNTLIKMSHQNPSSVIQHYIYRTLAKPTVAEESQHWLNHIARISEVYESRRKSVIAALEAQFASFNLVQWTTPTGGMSMWLRIEHGVRKEALETALAARGVLIIPGCEFFSGPRKQATDMHIRIAYTADVGSEETPSLSHPLNDIDVHEKWKENLQEGVEALATAIKVASSASRGLKHKL